MQRRLRALCIAYQFPLQSAPQRREAIVGGERVLQFTRRLPALGIDTHLITHHGSATTEVEPGVTAARDMFRAAVAGTWADMGRSQQREAESSDLRRQIPRWTLPDRPSYTWAPSAIRAGVERARRERFDLIFSTSPPMANHVVAAALSRILRLPWIADIRDGYGFEPPEGVMPMLGARRVVERGVLGRVSHLVAVTEPLAEDLRARLGLPSSRVTTITNGYDEAAIADALSRAAPLPAPPPLRIAYAGSTSVSTPERKLDRLLQAVRTLDAEAPGRISLQLIGQFASSEVVDVEGPAFEHTGWLPRADALGAMTRAHVLVVLSGNQRAVATSKLFEYIGLGRPVLVVGRRSAAAAIVEQRGLGIAVDDDAGQIRAALTSFAERWPEWQARLTSEALRHERETFSREQQATQLAAICRAVCEAEV